MHDALPLARQPLKDLLRRWFVQYNPAFTLSAMCVMGGVLLLRRVIGQDADVTLTLVVELYQWLVIGLGALLYRRLCEHRAGAILGIIALVFLIDPTLQVSALATGGSKWLIGGWVVSWALKWKALERGFRLRFSTSATLLPPVAAAFAVLLPVCRTSRDLADLFPTLSLVLVFGLGATVLLWPPRVESERTLTELGEELFPRVVKGAALLLSLGLLGQAINAGLAVGMRGFAPTAGAILLLAALKCTQERKLWALWLIGSWVLLANQGSHPEFLHRVPLLVVPLTLALRGARFGARVWAGALGSVALLYPVWTIHGGDIAAVDSMWWVRILVSVPLAVVMTKRRSVSALVVVGLVNFDLVLLALRGTRSFFAHGPSLLSSQGWGWLFVIGGFGLLPLGVWLQRKLARALDDGELNSSRKSRGPSPATSAAIASGG